MMSVGGRDSKSESRLSVTLQENSQNHPQPFHLLTAANPLTTAKGSGDRMEDSRSLTYAWRQPLSRAPVGMAQSYPLEEPLIFTSIYIVCVTCAVTIL